MKVGLDSNIWKERMLGGEGRVRKKEGLERTGLQVVFVQWLPVPNKEKLLREGPWEKKPDAEVLSRGPHLTRGKQSNL